jgi:hypothetical protein
LTASVERVTMIGPEIVITLTTTTTTTTLKE